MVAEWICYRKNQETKAIKHLLGIGFAVYYTVALIGAGNQLVFVYVIPMFILISVFSDSKYALELELSNYRKFYFYCSAYDERSR